MEFELQDSYVSHLLQSSFDDLLACLKDISSCSSISRSAMVSYAWPLIPSEAGIQERVLQMCEDLSSCGINAFMDITKGNLSTSFDTSICKWIDECDIVVLVGSSSYAARAKDPSTLTFHEAAQIGVKKKKDNNSIIPILLEGRFASSFPAGYQDTIGSRFMKLSDYMRDLPQVAASILGISGNAEVKRRMKEYTQQAEHTIKNAVLPENEREQAAKNFDTLKQYWRSRVLVLQSKFSLSQLKQIDGNVKKRTLLMDGYHDHISSLLSDTKGDEYEDDILKLDSQVDPFFNSASKVLLLCAPLPIFTRYYNGLALKALRSQNMLPILVDLPSISSPTENGVDKALMQYSTENELGLDQPTITQAKLERSFIIITTGFEECTIHTNFYIRNRMASFAGKAVFMITPECWHMTPSIQLYFTPSSVRSPQHPDPDGLTVVKYFVTTTGSALPVMLPHTPRGRSRQEEIPSLLPRNQRHTSLAEAKSEAAVTGNNKKQNTIKGFLLLQHDIIRVECLNFLAQLRSIRASSTTTEESCIQAFISYAWPQDMSTRDHLQKQLLGLVEDLSSAGIQVLLDIMQLHLGSDIKQFMRDGIECSNTILWIGTPDLKSRVTFNDKGEPSTNAAVEFHHIRDKSNATTISPATSSPSLPLWTIQSLLFIGNSDSDAYPSEHGLSTTSHDFRDERKYYLCLPQLVASIFGIAATPHFKDAYTTYQIKLDKLEQNFTPAAIEERLQQEDKKITSIQQEANKKLKQLLANVPKEYIAEQQVDNVKKQALITRLLQLKHESLLPHTPHAEALQFYVPLSAGAQPDTEPLDQFDAMQKVTSFISDKTNKRSLLIFGAAGSGKSLFARYVEQMLWKVWKGKDLSKNEVIPIFISLPLFSSIIKSASDNEKIDLVSQILEKLGYNPSDVAILLRLGHIAMIFDGLDEIALELLPSRNFLNPNHVTHNNNDHESTTDPIVIVMCRTQHVPILEGKISMNIHQYFGNPTESSQSLADAMHLMPFNGSQIRQFLEGYTGSPEAQLFSSDWSIEKYEQYINNTAGLASLVQTPFLLQLIVKILPQLVALQKTGYITSVDVYSTFTRQLFERETWKRLCQEDIKLSRNLLAELQTLAQRVAQSLFELGTTSSLLSLLEMSDTEMKLLSSLPVHIADGQIKFIHKSMQEFFVCQLWLMSLDSRNMDALSGLLNKQLVAQETGILGFLSQQVQHHHSNTLLQLALISRTIKNTKHIQIAASNAVTILNASHFSFSSLDLSGIEIPGADLSHAVMESTNLSHANLSGVRMHQTWLRHANLSKSVMNSIQLEEYPWMKGDSRCLCICIAEGRKLISGHESGNLFIWDVSTMKQVGDLLQGHSHSVLSVAFCDGNIVSGSADNTIRVWSISALNQIGDPLRGHTHIVTCVAVHNGKIASGSKDKTIRLWDIPTMKQIGLPLKGHTLNVSSVAIHDGKIVSSGWDDTIRIWDMATMMQIGDPMKGHTDTVTSIAVHDGKIVSGSWDKTVRVWDIATMKQVGDPLKGHTDPITSVAIHAGTIVSGSDDNSLRMWDMSTMRQIGNPLQGHTGHLTSVAILDGVIVSGSQDDTIRVWNRSALNQSDPMQGLTGSVTSIAIDGGKIVSGSTDFTLKVWDMSTMRQICTPLQGHKNTVTSVVIYDGKIVSGSADNTIRVWNLATMKPIGEPLKGHTGSVSSVAVHDGKIISGSLDATIRVWDLKTMQQIGDPLGHNNTVTSIAVHGGRIASGSWDKKIRVWDMETMEQIGSPVKAHSDTVTSIAIHNGKIISGSDDYTIKVWDMATRQQIGDGLKGHTDTVSSIAIYDGKIVSGSWDKTIRVWDMENMKMIGEPLEGHTHSVTSVAIHDEKIVSGSWDNSIRIWSMPTSIKEKEKTRPHYLIQSSSKLPLNFTKCNIEGVMGLSEQQKLVMLQRGTVGVPK